MRNNEFLGERVPNVRETVVDMQNARRVLSVDGKSLAEIHPTVSQDVETDTLSQDFGRIKNVGTAENMAHARNEEWDGSPNWIVDEGIDKRVASEIQAEVAEQEGEEVGRKAAQDYLITQGYEGPIRERYMDIRQDVHTRMVNPVAALKDIIKSRKAKQ